MELFLASVPSASAATCESLTSLSVTNGVVTMAQTVAPGAFTAPTGRAGGPPGGQNPFAKLGSFCRVAVTLKPASQSDIKAEIWLPSTGWNGKLQVVGNGGFAGTISYAAMATALAAGYAAASTDTGHTGPSPNTFANEDVLIDFAHRAIHETTVAAKAAVERILRQRPEAVVLQWLLDWWPPGGHGGATISRGLRRHHRRRAGKPHLDAGVRADLVLAGAGAIRHQHCRARS